MLLSVYTYVKNGLHYDFHVVEMLKHHLPLADEIVVNEGYSTDGTYEAIASLDSKIRITRSSSNFLPVLTTCARLCRAVEFVNREHAPGAPEPTDAPKCLWSKEKSRSFYLLFRTIS